jgi:hypothetical protein
LCLAQQQEVEIYIYMSREFGSTLTGTATVLCLIRNTEFTGNTRSMSDLEPKNKTGTWEIFNRQGETTFKSLDSWIKNGNAVDICPTFPTFIVSSCRYDM